MRRIVRFGQRLGPLFRLATEYSVAHVTARVLAAISGLMLVRLLPVSEYGFYTLLLTAFGFICTFSDLGATETLSFFRRRAILKGKSWQHYFDAVMRFRRVVFLFGFTASAAYIFFAVPHIGQGTSNTVMGIILVGLASWFSIQSGIISYVLKLEQRFRPAYALELSIEGVKLVAVALIWGLGLATALAGMSGVALGALVAAVLAPQLLGYGAAPISNPKGFQVMRSNRVLLGQIMPILPGTIHYTLQGVFVTWLAVYYGSVVNVAELGALGRLGILFGVVTGFTASVFVPRLLMISDERLFFRRYLYWWGVMISLGCLMMLAVLAFPGPLLFLLGTSYSGLNIELVISAAIAVVASWGAFSWHINRARGWTTFQIYRAPFIVAGQIPLFFLLNFSTTQGILIFSFLSVVLDMFFQTFINAYGFSNIHARLQNEKLTNN